MLVDHVKSCENTLRRALQGIRTSSDVSHVTQLYDEAKGAVMAVLKPGQYQLGPDHQRDLMSLMLYVHLAYRTKEADSRGMSRILAVR